MHELTNGSLDQLVREVEVWCREHGATFTILRHDDGAYESAFYCPPPSNAGWHIAPSMQASLARAFDAAKRRWGDGEKA